MSVFWVPRRVVRHERREGGVTTREGVDEEIPDAEGQNTVMVNTYSLLERSAPTLTT